MTPFPNCAEGLARVEGRAESNRQELLQGKVEVRRGGGDPCPAASPVQSGQPDLPVTTSFSARAAGGQLSQHP